MTQQSILHLVINWEVFYYKWMIIPLLSLAEYLEDEIVRVYGIVSY